MNLFLARSDFISSCDKQFQNKINQITTIQELKGSFSDLLLIENDYHKIFFDYIKQYLSDLQEGKIVNSTIYQITKELSNSINFWNHVSYLRFNSQSNLQQFWKSITLLSEFYDVDNVEELLRAIMLIKKHSKIQQQDESEFYQNLSTQIYESVMDQGKNVQYLSILANILCYFKQIKHYSNTNNFNFTQKTTDNLNKIAQIYIQIFLNCSIEGIEDSNYSKNKFLEKFKNDTPDQTLRYFSALSYLKIIPEQVINIIFEQLVNQGFRNFDKQTVIRFLSQCMVQDIKINEQIADEIRNSKKIIMDLTIREIYIIIHSFQASDLNIGQIYNNLYFATGLRIENMSPLIDFKSIMMIAKIHHYILTQKIHEHRRNYIDKRSQQVLQTISNSLTDQMISQNLNDVIYIVTLFMPYLNQPSFLIKEILKHRFEMQINTESRQIYSQFTMQLLDKLQDNYNIMWFINSSEQVYQNTLDKDVKQLLQYLVLKFRESKLLSYFLLTIHIGSHKSFLFSKIFSRSEERKHIIETSTKQILNLLRKESQKLGYSNIVLFSKFIYQNQADINQRFKQLVIEYISQILIKYSSKRSFSQNLEWVYYITNVLVEQKDFVIKSQNMQNQVQNSTINNKNKTLSPINTQQNNNINESNNGVFSDTLPKIQIIKKLKEFIQQEIIQFIDKQSQICYPEVQYENGIIQKFNQNIFDPAFQNSEYLYPIIHDLKIQLPELKLQKLLLILKRVCKVWEGNQLAQNIVLLTNLPNKKQEVSEILEIVSENLFTLMILNQQEQNIYVDYKNFDKEIVLKIVQAYAKQFKNYEISIPQNQQIKFLALPIFMNEVFNQVSLQDQITIISLVGNNIKYYPKQYIEKFNQKNFNVTNMQNLVRIWNKLPTFLQNQQLKEKVKEYLYDNQSLQISTGLLKALEKERIVNLPLNEQIEQICLSSDHDLYDEVLSYISITQTNMVKYQYKYLIKSEKDDKQKILNDLLDSKGISPLNNSNQNIKKLQESVYYLSNKIKNPQEIYNYQVENSIQNLFLKSSYFYNYTEQFALEQQQKQIQVEFLDSFNIKNQNYYPNFKTTINFQQENQDQEQSKQQTDNNQNNNKKYVQQQKIMTNKQNQNVTYDHTQKILYEGLSQDQNPSRQYQSSTFEIYEDIFKYFLYLEFNQDSMNELQKAQLIEQNVQNNQTNDMNSQLSFNYKQQQVIQILEAFKANQHQIYNELKIRENYTDFLIDITVGLQQQNYFYKTTYQCEDTQINIDIVIPEVKIGFIYLDEDHIQYNTQTGEYTPNNYAILKKYILEKYGGWKITCVFYQQWIQQYQNTFEKQQYINNIFKNNIE